LSITGGLVKFRITRYDEESRFGALNFPNGSLIWNFQTGHPKKPSTSAFSASGPNGLHVNCRDEYIQTFDDASSTLGIYDEAFILNELDSNNQLCWRLANNLLSRGAVTETCAQYDWMGAWDPNDNKGEGGRMDFIFVPCRDF